MKRPISLTESSSTHEKTLMVKQILLLIRIQNALISNLLLTKEGVTVGLITCIPYKVGLTKGLLFWKAYKTVFLRFMADLIYTLKFNMVYPFACNIFERCRQIP